MLILKPRKSPVHVMHEIDGRRSGSKLMTMETVEKSNNANPHLSMGYLTARLTAIVNGHKQSRVGELLSWNYPVE
jgi:hypothetical protein